MNHPLARSAELKTWTYVPDYLKQTTADDLLSWCSSAEHVRWQQERFRIYARECVSPRSLWWCGDHGVNYRYTGSDHIAEGWPAILGKLRDELSSYLQQPINFLLLNKYDHGGHYMGWHRDDEAGAAPRIASLSLGATRRFRLREGPGNVSEALQLAHGSLLIFDGRCQHTLTKTTRVCAPRINLTFRYVHNP